MKGEPVRRPRIALIGLGNLKDRIERNAFAELLGRRTRFVESKG